MNPLSSIASSNIADIFTKPLPTTTHQRIVSLVGAGTTVDPLAFADPTATVAAPTVVASPATVDTAPTVVASATTASSDSVPLLHPNPVPYLIDTGASFPIAPASASDFIAPFGLIRSATSVASKVASTPVDPYTLITGEDTTTTDLSSPDPFDLDSDLVDTFEFASAFEVLELREFGTATLIFISNPHSESELESILVEPILDWTDTWFDWAPLPRLTPTESYFHIFGLDYLQAFALFHLIPIWIYCLLHFGLE